MTGIPMRPEELAGAKGHDGGDPKKRQVKAGAVFRQEKNADGEIQRVPGSTTRVVTFEEVTSFSRMLMDDAVRRGYNSADTVVFTSDGAEWIWLMVADRFKGAVEIVDFYHAAEHLGVLCALAEPDKRKASRLRLVSYPRFTFLSYTPVDASRKITVYIFQNNEYFQNSINCGKKSGRTRCGDEQQRRFDNLILRLRA